MFFLWEVFDVLCQLRRLNVTLLFKGSIPFIANKLVKQIFISVCSSCVNPLIHNFKSFWIKYGIGFKYLDEMRGTKICTLIPLIQRCQSNNLDISTFPYFVYHQLYQRLVERLILELYVILFAEPYYELIVPIYTNVCILKVTAIY